MLASAVAPRNAVAALRFMFDLRSRVSNIRQLTSDGFYAHEGMVEDAFADDGVDFGMLVKPATTDVENRSIPRPRQRPVFGNPDPDRINTSYVQRPNLSLRMENRRYTRQTNAFSKTLETTATMLALWFTYYNFVPTHRGLGTAITPAMAPGLTNSPTRRVGLWS